MDMDLGMDIASYSMANAANNLMQGDALAKMMEMSVNPNVGANIDIRL